MKSLPRDPPAIRLKLSWLKVSGMGWAHGAAGDAATRFLATPRRWVRRLADCVASRDGLRPGSFVSVFVRDSVEKRLELASHGHGMPTAEQYESVSAALAAALGWRHVHLQTSNPKSVERFVSLANASGLRLSYTDNARSAHDSWGGWVQAEPPPAHLAAQARGEAKSAARGEPSHLRGAAAAAQEPARERAAEHERREHAADSVVVGQTMVAVVNQQIASQA